MAKQNPNEIKLTKLSKHEKREWDRIRPLLSQVGIHAIDEAMVRVYLRAYRTWCEATEMIDEDGLIVTTPNGSIQTHPAQSIVRQQSELLKKLAQELLISPGARKRAKVEVVTEDEESDLW